MASEFSDERISAYFDGELPEDERAAVEELLASSSEHRSMLQDIAAIRSEFQLLPQLKLGDDFARRVVAAAIEAASVEGQVAATAAPPLSSRSVSRKRKLWNSPLVAIPAIAAAVLIAVMIGRRTWRPAGPNASAVAVQPELISSVPTPVPSATEKALAQLRQAIPGQDEALVVRMRVPQSTLAARGIDAALTKSGIRLGRADQAALANHVGMQYRQKITAPANSAVAVSDAVFIEAPFEQLQATIAELDRQSATKLDLRLEMVVAAKLPPSSEDGDAEAEGGGGKPIAGPQGPTAHRLNAGNFALPAEAPASLATPNAVLPAVQLDPKRSVRVLILIEAGE